MSRARAALLVCALWCAGSLPAHAATAVDTPVDPLNSPSWQYMRQRFLGKDPMVFDARVQVQMPSAAEDQMQVPVHVSAPGLTDAERATYERKIKTREQLRAILGPFPRAKKVIMCHGTFDLVHPGHIRHLLYAKSKGDRLIVSKYAYGWSYVSPTIPNPAAIFRSAPESRRV